jgi:putative N6-adenine-specific DNA methylase
MNQLSIFLPCSAGVEAWLASEIAQILHRPVSEMRIQRAGVALVAGWREVLLINLYARLPQRVLIQLSQSTYRQEQDIYEAASAVPWELWFTPRQTFKIEVTSQYSPLKSLNFAALRVKDAVADRFRERKGTRPNVEVKFPDIRLHAHLTADQLSLYLDTSGEPLFKRGWRVDKGDAPLKETLAAAMLAACGWSLSENGQPSGCQLGLPLYDPCCGSGTIVIEAAQIACNMAAGSLRRFAFEKLIPYEQRLWSELKEQAKANEKPPMAKVFGSDVAHRMVDFAQRNAQRAGVSHVVELRGGDALQRMPPCEQPGLILVNPPYGERITAAGIAGRERAQISALSTSANSNKSAGTDFFVQLASHWKHNFSGWNAWMLSPDMKLPGHMRLKESRRIPFWNGPIECRMFRFELVAGRHAG